MGEEQAAAEVSCLHISQVIGVHSLITCSALNEEKRNRAGKDAFFKVMSKSTHVNSRNITVTVVDPKSLINVQESGSTPKPLPHGDMTAQQPADEMLNAQVRSLQVGLEAMTPVARINLRYSGTN